MIKQITRKEWIEALKSGEYKQTPSHLYSRTHNGYCCIGVAGKLCGADFINVPPSATLTTVFLDDFVSLDKIQALGLAIRNEFEIDDDSVANNVLAKFNDEGKTFEQIADLLIFDSWIRGMEQD